MDRKFSDILSELRKKRGISQRKAAADLHVSQALMSHYENGAREPGLNFVCRACDYYGVTADYLLGRTDDNGTNKSAVYLDELVTAMRRLTDDAEEKLSELNKR